MKSQNVTKSLSRIRILFVCFVYPGKQNSEQLVSQVLTSCSICWIHSTHAAQQLVWPNPRLASKPVVYSRATTKDPIGQTSEFNSLLACHAPNKTNSLPQGIGAWRQTPKRIELSTYYSSTYASTRTPVVCAQGTQFAERVRRRKQRGSMHSSTTSIELSLCVLLFSESVLSRETQMFPCRSSHLATRMQLNLVRLIDRVASHRRDQQLFDLCSFGSTPSYKLVCIYIYIYKYPTWTL